MNGLRLPTWMKAWQLLVVGFVAIYAATLAMFLSEGHPRLTVRGVGAQAVTIEAEFIAVDLVRETISLSLIPNLSKADLGHRGLMTRDVSVEIDTGGGLLRHIYKSGEVPIPWVATVPIEDGDQLEYPLDRHSGDFHIRLLQEGAASAAPNMALDKVMHGFRLTAKAEASADGTDLDLHYTIRRSPAVLLLAIFGMVSLLLVVTSAINVAWQVSARGRKPEFSMMTWIAALLFVVPAVRNGLPGAPPPGALIDIALFFWLHVMAAGSLLFVVKSWTRAVP